jgi:hypothetical protein
MLSEFFFVRAKVAVSMVNNGVETNVSGKNGVKTNAVRTNVVRTKRC